MGPETVVLDFRNVLCANLFRTRSSATASRSPRNWYVRCCGTTGDWVNTIFLSTRFWAWRVGGYNEYLYHVLQSASPTSGSPTPTAGSPRRDDVSDDHAGRLGDAASLPHLKADLSKFGVVDGS